MSTEWFGNAVIYHILIDRFAGFTVQENKSSPKQPGFMGGTLSGITEKLDYIQNLGMNTIWLSPFYKTTAYHGYHITDFYSVEPRFGTLGDLKVLIKAAHDRGLRTIADFVPNHCSYQHPFFKDAKSNPESPYRNWFFFSKWPNKYRAFFDFFELPKLNVNNPETAQHLLEAAEYWTRMGIDGFRIDHAVGVPKIFLKDLSRAIKKENPNAILIGEAWMANPGWKYLQDIDLPNKYLRRLFGCITQEFVQREYVGILDGVLDFFVRDLMLEFIAHKD
ncbi:MAG: hypothetical protein JW904_12915 [Spirochaetales bacterium]|nr:hypothetical protein [Spirochaetales bacterium]